MCEGMRGRAAAPSTENDPFLHNMSFKWTHLHGYVLSRSQTKRSSQNSFPTLKLCKPRPPVALSPDKERALAEADAEVARGEVVPLREFRR